MSVGVSVGVSVGASWVYLNIPAVSGESLEKPLQEVF